MTLSQKLVLLLALFCAILIGSVASTAWAIGVELHAAFDRFANASWDIAALDRFQDRVVAEIRACVQMDLASENLLIESTRQEGDRLAASLDRSAVADAPAEAPTAGQRMRDALRRCDLAYQSIRGRAAGDRRPSPEESDQFTAAIVAPLRRASASIRAELNHAVQAAAELADHVQSLAMLVLAGSIGAGLTISLVGAYLARRWLTAPVEILSDASLKFARGDLDHRIGLPGRDELARLAGQMNTMADSLKHLRQRLVERERMASVGQFCSAVARGLQGPLEGVRLSGEAALTGERLDATSHRRIANVLTECGRLRRRVSRLLDYARTGQFDAQPLDMTRVVGTAAEEMRPRLSGSGLTLSVRCRPARGVYVMGNREMLTNAVIEALSNAAEQPADRSVILLECEARADRVTVRVRDHGPGLAPEVIQRAFELFYTTKRGGSGIGLASIRRIVELHGGTVTLANDSGGGAVVTLDFPRARVSANDPDAQNVGPSSLKSDHDMDSASRPTQ